MSDETQPVSRPEIRALGCHQFGHCLTNIVFKSSFPEGLTDMEKQTSCDCYFFPPWCVWGHWSVPGDHDVRQRRPGEGGQPRTPGGDMEIDTASQLPVIVKAGQVNSNPGKLVRVNQWTVIRCI